MEFFCSKRILKEYQRHNRILLVRNEIVVGQKQVNIKNSVVVESGHLYIQFIRFFQLIFLAVLVQAVRSC